MLTGKDVYAFARPFFEKQGIHMEEWKQLPEEPVTFYTFMAASLNEVHIAPLQGLVKELAGLIEWDNFTEGYEEDTLKRVKQLCGDES